MSIILAKNLSGTYAIGIYSYVQEGAIHPDGSEYIVEKVWPIKYKNGMAKDITGRIAAGVPGSRVVVNNVVDIAPEYVDVVIEYARGCAKWLTTKIERGQLVCKFAENVIAPAPKHDLSEHLLIVIKNESINL